MINGARVCSRTAAISAAGNVDSRVANTMQSRWPPARTAVAWPTCRSRRRARAPGGGELVPQRLEAVAGSRSDRWDPGIAHRTPPIRGRWSVSSRWELVGRVDRRPELERPFGVLDHVEAAGPDRR
jgi:hypothetical protein